MYICLVLDVMCDVSCCAHVFSDFLDAVLVMTLGSFNDVPYYRLP